MKVWWEVVETQNLIEYNERDGKVRGNSTPSLCSVGVTVDSGRKSVGLGIFTALTESMVHI